MVALVCEGTGEITMLILTCSYRYKVPLAGPPSENGTELSSSYPRLLLLNGKWTGSTMRLVQTVILHWTSVPGFGSWILNFNIFWKPSSRGTLPLLSTTFPSTVVSTNYGALRCLINYSVRSIIRALSIPPALSSSLPVCRLFNHPCLSSSRLWFPLVLAQQHQQTGKRGADPARSRMNSLHFTRSLTSSDDDRSGNGGNWLRLHDWKRRSDYYERTCERSIWLKKKFDF